MTTANWMDWSAPNVIEQREVDGKKQIRTPLHGWFGRDDPGSMLKTWEYLGYLQGLRAAKCQERAARLARLLKKSAANILTISQVNHAPPEAGHAPLDAGAEDKGDRTT